MRFLFLLMLVCCQLPTSSGELEPIIIEEWKIAQECLTSLGFKVDYMTPERFRWRKREGTFSCGGVEANGCFYSGSRTIEWNSEAPQVIRHESGHAMLWDKGTGLWRCYEHPEKSNCPEALQRGCKQ